MFDIGFWELLIIAVVLLLVLGPERLPEFAKQAAFFVRKARQGMYRLRSEMQSEMDGSPLADLKKAKQEMADLKNDLKQFGHELADSHEDSLNSNLNDNNLNDKANQLKETESAEIKDGSQADTANKH